MFLLPVPFALLCILLFLRTSKAILTVPLQAAVWIAAFWSAMWANGSLLPVHHAPMLLAGFIGGFGVAASCGICKRRLLSPRHLIGAAVIGVVAALPFEFWLSATRYQGNGPADPLQPARLHCSFAIWQAVVGTYLYTVSTWSKGTDKNAHSNSHEAC